MPNHLDQNKPNPRNTKMLENRAREIILSVRDFCEAEKMHGHPIIPFHRVRSRVAAMTGISEKTVSRITTERKLAESTSPINMKTDTPGRKPKIVSKTPQTIKNKNNRPGENDHKYYKTQVEVEIDGEQHKDDKIISKDYKDEAEIDSTSLIIAYTKEEYLEEEYLEDDVDEDKDDDDDDDTQR